MKKFKKTYIEITNACNMDCDFCPKTKRPAQFMAKELFAEILQKVKGHSGHLYFHVMGEPLLHPEIGLFAGMAGDAGYRVNLTTNARLIEKLYPLIGNKGIRQFNFSIQSMAAKREELAPYMNNIFSFIDEAKKTGIHVFCLRLWNIKDGNTEENKRVTALIKDKFGAEISDEPGPTHVRGIKLADNVFFNRAEQFEWPDLSGKETGENGFCLALREQVAILVDGTVVPCCLDCDGNISLGNIKDASGLNDIIAGKRAKSIYDGFSAHKAVEPLCRRCSYRSRFD